MESEMDAEMRFHLEARAEDLMRSGVPRAEAMRRARIEFGGMEGVKEECRETGSRIRREHFAGCAVRLADVAEESRVHGDCGADVGVGDWRQ